MASIVDYPVGAIKLNKFFGPSVRLLVDGAPFENHRLDIIFPNEAELKSAMEKLVRVAVANREDAIRFILGVLDEFQSVQSGIVNSKEIVG